MKARPKIAQLHYITQDIEGTSHTQLAFEACRAGVELVQLRIKNQSFDEHLRIARKVKSICQQYGVQLIINDSLEIACAVEADGVHLGNADMPHTLARKRLGIHKLIGATAYSAEEATHHLRVGIADYIGLGTFRPTQTKPEITTFLTLEEIAQLIQAHPALGSSCPIIAIGGIRLTDIQPLLQAGVHGIAVASLINRANDKPAITQAIFSHLNR